MVWRVDKMITEFQVNDNKNCVKDRQTKTSDEVIILILPRASNCSEIWNANSLVGVRIKAK
jgi:hypothetical protein